MAGPLDRSLVVRLHRQAQAARWDLPVDGFGRVLEASLAHGFPAAAPSPADCERYLTGLHLEDLALAAACAGGHDRAWEHFIREHRPGLYRAADAIDPNGGVRDLADSLYGELFGLGERQGARQSLFRYFHGRSKLSTWLRAVLAQRHVDRIRATRRLDPLPDEDAGAHALAREDDVDPERARLSSIVTVALAAAVAALVPRDRLRLSCYYVQNLKLAAIGRLLREHEATVSRHLARTRAELREAVEARLRQGGLDAAAIRRGFEVVAQDPGTLDLAELVGVAAPQGDAAALARTPGKIVQ